MFFFWKRNYIILKPAITSNEDFWGMYNYKGRKEITKHSITFCPVNKVMSKSLRRSWNIG